MNQPEYAFILAAGKGTRLRPYTETLPKPMVPVNDKPIIAYTLDKLKKEGVKSITINTGYLGDRIKKFADEYSDLKITLSPEEELLETGGGVKKALHTMQGHPFYLINGDALWSDGTEPGALKRLANAWNPDIMDILILLQPLKNMTLTHGIGDYDIKANGQGIRMKNKNGAYMFAGIRIVKPEIFDNSPDGVFSFLELMDKAEQQGRLYGVIHNGEWHHISTPEDLENVSAALTQRKMKAALE